jgi:hypothetical protein
MHSAVQVYTLDAYIDELVCTALCIQVCTLDAHMIRLLMHSTMFTLCKHTHEFKHGCALHDDSSITMLYLSATHTIRSSWGAELSS